MRNRADLAAGGCGRCFRLDSSGSSGPIRRRRRRLLAAAGDVLVDVGARDPPIAAGPDDSRHIDTVLLHGTPDRRRQGMIGVDRPGRGRLRRDGPGRDIDRSAAFRLARFRDRIAQAAENRAGRGLGIGLQQDDVEDAVGVCTAVRKPSSGAPAFVPARAA